MANGIVKFSRLRVRLDKIKCECEKARCQMANGIVKFSRVRIDKMKPVISAATYCQMAKGIIVIFQSHKVFLNCVFKATY